jgi:hypothetical protein
MRLSVGVSIAWLGLLLAYEVSTLAMLSLAKGQGRAASGAGHGDQQRHRSVVGSRAYRRQHQLVRYGLAGCIDLRKSVQQRIRLPSTHHGRQPRVVVVGPTATDCLECAVGGRPVCADTAPCQGMGDEDLRYSPVYAVGPHEGVHRTGGAEAAWNRLPPRTAAVLRCRTAFGTGAFIAISGHYYIFFLILQNR